jgi:hypothetical protein
MCPELARFVHKVTKGYHVCVGYCLTHLLRKVMTVIPFPPLLLLQVDRDLMLYLPRLAVLVTIVADRPGAWFPGQLGPYQACFPAICLSRDFKHAKMPGNPIETPLCFGVFWGVIFKKKLFSQVDSR